MHDLKTLSAKNQQAYDDALARNDVAIAGAVDHFNRQGGHVVVTYAGLHIESIETFSDRNEAIAAFQKAVDNPSTRRQLHPTSIGQEVAHALRTRMLGDYINHVQADEGR